MSIYKTTRIRCDECGYEEPNDYYCGEKDWIFVTELETDEERHFCSEDCLNFQAETDKIIFTNRKSISNISDEYKALLK